MKIKVFILFFICFFFSTVQAEIVKDKKNIAVNTIDLEVLLEIAPIEAQKGLLNNRKQLLEQIEQLYLKKSLANLAKQEGIDDKPMNKARISAILDNALFLLKLNDLEKENNKDYTNYAKQIYLANKDKYKAEERIDAAHILVSIKERTEEEALKKATALRKDLKEGVSFEKLAVKESDDKSVEQNKGELGAFTKDQLVKPFIDAAVKLKAGEISEPVKTVFGYHIIKLNKVLPPGIKPFEEVKEEIIAKLRKDDWELTRADFFKNLKNENAMKINEDELNSFVDNKLKELK